MITIAKTDKIKLGLKNKIVLAELRGLSTDTKPEKMNGQDIENGSIFIEIDTGDIYFYDLENKQWKKA